MTAPKNCTLYFLYFLIQQIDQQLNIWSTILSDAIDIYTGLPCTEENYRACLRAAAEVDYRDLGMDIRRPQSTLILPQELLPNNMWLNGPTARSIENDDEFYGANLKIQWTSERHKLPYGQGPGKWVLISGKTSKPIREVFFV